MSEGWSKLLDVGPLADARAQVDFSIPLKEFPRVAPLLAATDGAASGRVEFSREGRIAVAEVNIAAQLSVLCQRCLAPFIIPVAARGRVALVGSSAEGEQVPEELETVLAPEHRISTRDLVEEELLLALPLVPRHEDVGCAGAKAGTAAGQESQAEPAGERHRPFEQLSELFKRP